MSYLLAGAVADIRIELEDCFSKFGFPRAPHFNCDVFTVLFYGKYGQA